MATTVSVVRADPKHYVWWFPGSPVKVHLDLQMVQRLKDRLENHGPRAAEEGLLFGSVSDGAAEIFDFQPASNGNVTGMIAALPKERGDRFLMGYYRTEEGETFHLTPKDFSLAEEYFTKPFQVFLMIHSNGFGSPNATFFFRDGDRKMADFAFLEFPLDPAILAVEQRGRIARSQQADISTTPVSPAPVPSPLEGPRKPRRLILKTIVGSCSIALIFALGVLVSNPSLQARLANLRRAIFSPAAVSSAPPPILQFSSSPLIALHAKRQNGDLELTWNRESAWISAAISGVITIHDGTEKRQIPLDAAQVRGGSLLYSPSSEQVLMELSVTTQVNTVTESVMVLLPKTKPPNLSPPPSSGPPQPAGLPESPSKKARLAEASKPFTAPTPAKGALPPAPILTDPPSSQMDFQWSTTPAPGIVSRTSAPAAPAPATPSPDVVPTPPTPLRVVRYQPAEVISKAPPVFPPELPAMFVARTVVEVAVSIDKSGKVTKAEATPQKNVSQFLINSAVTAARRWKFRPAQRGDEPVSSEMVLQFIFDH
jgi:protein TonB